MEYIYLVQVPMADGATWFELCSVTTPDGAAEVIRVLLEADKSGPTSVKVVVVPAEVSHG